MNVENHCDVYAILTKEEKRRLFPSGFEKNIIAKIANLSSDHDRCSYCLMLGWPEQTEYYCYNFDLLYKITGANLINLLRYRQSQLAKGQSR